MYHILEAVVRWLAPILSFTAEDIWRHMPGDREASVFLATWYRDLFPLAEPGDFDAAYWRRLIAVRETVGKRLEHVRVAGGIGSSLEAELDLYCDGALYRDLARLGDELRFFFITSYARLHPLAERTEDALPAQADGQELAIAVTVSAHPKCVRCWHRREDVGGDPDHPDICGRCVDNIAGPGEKRRFA
jgi:isoleucyl-tRNA synthetase